VQSPSLSSPYDTLVHRLSAHHPIAAPSSARVRGHPNVGTTLDLACGSGPLTFPLDRTGYGPFLCVWSRRGTTRTRKRHANEYKLGTPIKQHRSVFVREYP
jgi:hypothetical protein